MSKKNTSRGYGRFILTVTLTAVLGFSPGCDADDTDNHAEQIEIAEQPSSDMDHSGPSDLANPLHPTQYTTTRWCSGKKSCDKLKANCNGDYDTYTDTTKPGGTPSGKCETVHCLTEDP